MTQPAHDDTSWPQYRDNVSYSNKSRLNTLEWCIPRPTSNRNGTQIWVIYIHGGAWRDPEIDASSFNATRDLLLQSPKTDQVAGYASINYRLSPYPAHPRVPSRANDPARNSHHPDHILDVLAALLHLQETFQFGDRYLLVGHSCGATLALQVAMKRSWDLGEEPTPHRKIIAQVVPPVAILVVEGIYDLPALVQYHRDQSVYRDLVVNAFGEEEKLWADVSPSRASFANSWPDGKLVVLAHSHDDELVEWEQVQVQHEAFVKQGWSEDGARRVRLIEVQGGHDEIWKDAKELARVVEVALRELLDMTTT